jgi:hypothetical protein
LFISDVLTGPSGLKKPEELPSEPRAHPQAHNEDVPANREFQAQSGGPIVPTALLGPSPERVIRAKLAATDPSNAQWQRDLSISLTALANTSAQRERHDEALDHALASLEIDERLVVLDPTNVSWSTTFELGPVLPKLLWAAR